MATYALLVIWCQKTLPAITIQFEIIDRFVISRNKSSMSDTTDGGSDDLPSEDANTPSMNSQNYETIKAATTLKDNPCSLERKKTFNISCLKSFEGQQTLMRQSAKV